MYIGQDNSLAPANTIGPVASAAGTLVVPSGGGDIPQGITSPCPPDRIIYKDRIVEKKIMVPVPGPVVTVPGPVQTVYRDRDCPAQSQSQSAQTQNALIPVDQMPMALPSSDGEGVSDGNLYTTTDTISPKSKFPWWLIAAAAVTVYVMRDEIFG